MSFYESFDFSEAVIEVGKIAFSFERLYERIILTEFGGTFFAGFFPGVFFSYAKEKIHRKTTLQKRSQ